MMKVKEIAKVQAGSTPLRSNKIFYENGTIPWVKTLDLNNREIKYTEEFISESAIEKTSCKVRPLGTVLVAMYGGFNQIGRTGLLAIEAATNQAVSAIMVDKEVIRPEFLHYVLNAKVEYWKKVAISSRKDPNITKNDVENFPVPVPNSFSVQDNIIEKIKELIAFQEKLTFKISTSRNLQKSLINQIF
ncbi:MAG: restriction endonuclease subunit S [Candidatus Electrothrix sp. AR1]|nr:restriction endonuclease subunit S [Candidatus Electrothrix sp. AR1]